MTNTAEKQPYNAELERGWVVKLLPMPSGYNAAKSVDVEVLLHRELNWVVLKLDAVEGWGAMHALTGDVVTTDSLDPIGGDVVTRGGRVRVWATASEAMRALEHICPDCYGSVGEIMARLAPCAACDGTGRL